MDDIFKKEGSSICPLSDARLLFAYCLHSHARLGHHHLKIRPYIMHYAHTLQSRPYTLHQRSTSLTALDTCTYKVQAPPFRVDHFIFSASLRRSILIRITIECVCFPSSFLLSPDVPYYYRLSSSHVISLDFCLSIQTSAPSLLLPLEEQKKREENKYLDCSKRKA